MPWIITRDDGIVPDNHYEPRCPYDDGTLTVAKLTRAGRSWLCTNTGSSSKDCAGEVYWCEADPRHHVGAGWCEAHLP